MKRRVTVVKLYRELVRVENWQEAISEEHLGVANRKQRQVGLAGFRPIYLVRGELRFL